MKERESTVIAPSLQRQNITLGGFITEEMMQKFFLGYVNIQIWKHSGKCGVSHSHSGVSSTLCPPGQGIIDKKCDFYSHKVASALLFLAQVPVHFSLFSPLLALPLSWILWGFQLCFHLLSPGQGLEDKYVL